MTEQQNNPQSAAEYISKRPWRPSVEPDTYPSLEEIVGQAVGAGSVCWTSTPNGIFNSEQAKWIVDGAVEAIKRTIELDNRASYPWISPLANQTEGSSLVSLQTSIQKQLEHDIDLLQGGYRPDITATVFEYMTRAYNAGYQDAQGAAEKAPYGADERTSHIPGVTDEPAKVSTFDEPSTFSAADEPAKECGIETGHAEEPEEAKAWRLQRDADKAAVIDLILSYRNHASDAEKLRQIRVVMD